MLEYEQNKTISKFVSISKIEGKELFLKTLKFHDFLGGGERGGAVVKKFSNEKCPFI